MDKKNQNIILNTKNLSIGYNNRKDSTTIASNINIELNSGELVGLIGANGIGKSTLLRTLTKVQPKLSGEIEINGKPLDNYSNIELLGHWVLFLSFSLNTFKPVFSAKNGGLTYLAPNT